MAEVIIRQAVPGDAGSIYEIENLCFPDPWSMDALTYELEGNPRAFLYRGRGLTAKSWDMQGSGSSATRVI